MVCGVLGLLGLFSIAFHYFATGELTWGFLLFAQFFAIYLFLYVAIWDVSPIDNKMRN